MSELSEALDQLPKNLRPIYWAVGQFFICRREAATGEFDARDFRKIQKETTDMVVFGGSDAALTRPALDQLEKFHGTLAAHDPGLAFLLAAMVGQLCHLRGDLREQNEDARFYELGLADVNAMLDAFESGHNPWFEAVMASADLVPEVLLQAREKFWGQSKGTE